MLFYKSETGSLLIGDIVMQVAGFNPRARTGRDVHYQVWLVLWRVGCN